MANSIKISGRNIGPGFKPLVIAEIGINHEGNFKKAVRMVLDAARAGCECVKIQTHVVEDEMVFNRVVPGNAKETIWNMMQRCALTFDQERQLKKLAESKGMIFLSTPFSRAAADRLQKMDVPAFKIGSGECNNYPLVEHIASFGKPVILSTGMNDLKSIKKAVDILRREKIPHALLHCTSIYPTPYEKVRLKALEVLKENFPETVLGLSDHSLGHYTCLAAVAMGASILEKHFTSDKKWPGADIPISVDPEELKHMIHGSEAVHKAISGGQKDVLKEERPTIDFAYACVVSIADIKKGDKFTKENIWVKRPGTGQIKAVDFKKVLGKTAAVNIRKDSQIAWKQVKNIL